MVLGTIGWGLLGVVFALGSLVPYLVSTLKGRTRPHIFTWAIWSFTTMIAFLVQFAEGAGPGAWPTGTALFLAVLILIASFRHGEKNITRSDWMSFILAMMVVPVWLLTKNPGLAAIWVALVDGLGYYPTCRKSWNRPNEEMVWSRFMSLIKHISTLFALSSVSVATAVYPATLVVLNTLLIVLLLWRRRVLYSAPVAP